MTRKRKDLSVMRSSGGEIDRNTRTAWQNVPPGHLGLPLTKTALLCLSSLGQISLSQALVCQSLALALRWKLVKAQVLHLRHLQKVSCLFQRQYAGLPDLRKIIGNSVKLLKNKISFCQDFLWVRCGFR